MAELRDLYPIGDDEDVAALTLYRHLHCGHCYPRQSELGFKNEAVPNAKQERPWWIGLFK